jgi:ferredoxin
MGGIVTHVTAEQDSDTGTSGNVTVEVNRDVCIGAGNCSLYAPRTFDHDDDGIVVLVDANASDIEELRLAEHNCPSEAIRLREGGD